MDFALRIVATLRSPCIGIALVFLGSIANIALATVPSDVVSTTSVIQRPHFPEPFVATTPTTPNEDAALVRALTKYERRTTPDDFSSLTDFLKQLPHSGWNVSLLTNLGLSYLHTGYFSRARDAFHEAWVKGRSARGPHAEALVDRAVGELLRLDASLGRMDDVTAVFREIGDRPLTGSATEDEQMAAEVSAIAKKDPRHLFLCGPFALRSLMIALGVPKANVKFLEWYVATAKGTNLAEVGHLADEANFPHRLVFRSPDQNVPVPSVMHWRVGHFAAIVGQAYGRFHIIDSVFPGHELWVTQAAIDAEASGYFLVPDTSEQNVTFRSVSDQEAADVWGKGPTYGTPPGAAGPQQDPNANGADGPGTGDPGSPGNGPNGCMCGYNIGESTVSLNLSDTPVGYVPSVGPTVRMSLTYNQREASQPANFNYFNVSQKWTLNWLTYVTDTPGQPGVNVSRYLPGGGAYTYSGYSSATSKFAAQNNDGSILALTSQTPITYQRYLRNGGIEIYAQSNGALSYPRYIFLSQVIDPQGNTVTLNYDSQMRLTSITDATGRQTKLTYGLTAEPLLVTAVTDPFNRTASFTYDTNGRLASITDVLGLTSSFTYDANSLVNSMTTPYGPTNFAYTAPGISSPPRFVQVTDPLGYNEREEWLEPAPISDSDPANTVPQGMPLSPTNQYLTYRDSFHWDKNQYILASCTPSGGCDYTKARDRHFAHVDSPSPNKSTTIESVKYPLETRVWFNYPGQPDSIHAGTFEQPTAVGRVLDDGTTQLTQYSYDSTGYFNLTQMVDPVGRVTSFTYPNHVDLSTIVRTVAHGVQTTIAQFAYNSQHRPLSYTDAAGQLTGYAYNAAGQITAVTNALNQKTQYQYNTTGDLTAVINADNITAASYTYDAFDRVATYTDSEGWTVAYSYDNANRVTKITYPDGTSDNYTYNKLDLASYTDRLGRVWTYVYDADRRLTSVTDPLGHQTLFGYNPIGEPTSLTDPMANVTSWSYDVEGRLISKQYPDGSTNTRIYENTTSRLRLATDTLGQIKQYSYTEDNRLAGINYLYVVNPTPNISFAYDQYFARVTSMTDGTGTTQYSYVPVGSLGALELAQESSPLPNSAISYGYDALGRLSSRTVTGAGPETFGYDAIGRLTSHASDLGAFTLGYLGQTRQIISRQLVNSTLATTWSYLPNSGDRRLAGINNTGLSSGQYSNFSYTTNVENFVTGITESSDAATVYPSPGVQAASYNALNQLTNTNGQPLSFDANGNLLSDGQRNYSWDAENRLVGISYPGQSGKQTAFSYDGASRRTAISSTPTGGGTAVTASYLWCGAQICQGRNADGTTTIEYESEGEFVPGSPGQPYYYGIDQIGSVRRAFVSASSAPAFSYDPYGITLQTTTPATDFNYANMYYNTDSGLNLTQYRAYDPNAGRWLSRDPMGENGNATLNLYAYVNGNPVTLIDLLGLVANPPPIPGPSGNGSGAAGCPPGGQPPILPVNAVPPPAPPSPWDQLQGRGPEPPTILGVPVTPNQYAGIMAGGIVIGGAGIYVGIVWGTEAGAEWGAGVGFTAGGPIGGILGGIGGGLIGGVTGAFGGVVAGSALDAAGIGAPAR